MSQRIAPKFAPKGYVLPTVRLRSRFGQHHKSLFDNYKPFIHNHLQTRVSDFESEGIYSIFSPSFAIIGGKVKRKKTYFHTAFQLFSRSRKLLIVQCNIDKLISIIR